jgi:transcription elongation factor Elf1
MVGPLKLGAPATSGGTRNEVMHMRSGQRDSSALYVRRLQPGIACLLGESEVRMDLDESPETACLSFACPHCGAIEVDDFEVLAPDKMYVLGCDACKRRFHLLLAECVYCAEESVLTWAAVPTPSEIRSAACRRCGEPLTDHVDELRGLGPD